MAILVPRCPDANCRVHSGARGCRSGGITATATLQKTKALMGIDEAAET
jgi:hypothetical protein